MIEIYSSALIAEPVERHDVAGMSLHDWLTANCPSYNPAADWQPLQVGVAGRIVPPAEWPELMLSAGVTVKIIVIPRDGVSLWVIGALVLGAVAVAFLLRPNIPKSSTRTALELKAADVQANTPRLNGVIPEIAGQYCVFPDYLCQPRRYFVDKQTQAIDLMLCIGVGDFQIDAMNIGDASLDDFAGVDAEVFGPGADVSGHLAHRNWHNCPNVGGTRGSAGIRLTSGAAGTANAEADSYTITGSSIIVLPGAGALPQDWEVGTVVSIRAWTSSIEVVDGGGTLWSPNRDIVRCDLTGLDLAVDDVITIDGAGVNDGRYKVVSVTTGITEAGSASTITGAVVASLAYSTTPVTLYIAGQTCLLNANYADAAALAAAIDGQVAGVTVTQSGGVITVTDDSPFDGQMITLSGNYSPVFGATPYFVTGTPSRSYDELTLDRWTETPPGDAGEITAGYVAAGSLKVGEFSGVCLQKPRLKEVTVGLSTVSQYVPTEYRITSLVSGTLPDATTGTVGFEFQRLNPDGTDDSGWAGFYPETTTGEVEMLFASEIVGGWTEWFPLTPGAETATRIENDFFLPAGLGRFNREGKLRSYGFSVDGQYRIDGGATESVLYTFRDATIDQLGFTFGIDIPSGSKNVQMRFRRIGAEPTDSNYMARCEWYGARALLSSPTSYAGVTTAAITITGSDKLAAQTENKINMLVTRKFDGVADRSIASWVRYVAGDVGYSADDINEAELDALDTVWQARGDTYDNALVDQTTVKDELAQALRAGFAEATIDNGKIRPVRDEPRTEFEHLYTPQAMPSGTALVRKFKTQDPDDYDGVDVEFTSAETWKQETVECRLAGDIGTRVDKIKLEGVTDRTRAWRIGMRVRRGHLYRRQEYSFSTELAALNSRYLSYCALSDDVPGYGQSSVVIGWEPDTVGGVLTVSEPMHWVDGADHVVALRRPDGTACGPIAATQGADEYEIVIAEDIDFDIVIDGPEEPTHIIFGTLTTWSYPALITDIAPSGETVDVSAVKYDARMYEDDDNEPPT